MSIVRTLSGEPEKVHAGQWPFGGLPRKYYHDWSKERCLYFDGAWHYPANCCDAILGADKPTTLRAQTYLGTYEARKKAVIEYMTGTTWSEPLGGGSGGVEEREGGYEIRYGGYPSCATLGCKYQMYSEGEGRYYWHAPGCTYWLPEGRRKPIMGIRDRLKQCQESGCYPAYSENGDEITWIHNHPAGTK